MSASLRQDDPQRRITGGNQSATRFDIAGPLLVSSRRFGDHRGFFLETYSARDFAALGIPDVFVQDNHSLSAEAGTVRGMHFQLAPHAQAKLVRVLRGAILDIAVDIRRSSPTYGRHVAVELSAANGHQLYVPVGFAHGFCTLERDTVISYKVTGSYYSAECDKGVAWDDPAIGIEWPDVTDPSTLSAKDGKQPLLVELPSYFQYQD